MKNSYLLALCLMVFISCKSSEKMELNKPVIKTSENPWEADIDIKVNEFNRLLNYIDELNPKESLLYSKIGDDTKVTLNELNHIYISELQTFQNWHGQSRRKIENNGNRYLSTTLEIENLLFLTDVYAILINPIRLTVNKKIEENTRNKAIKLIEIIEKQTEKIKKNTANKEIEKFINDTKGIRARIYQGSLNEEERKKYRFIDYLLLMQRLEG